MTLHYRNQCVSFSINSACELRDYLSHIKIMGPEFGLILMDALPLIQTLIYLNAHKGTSTDISSLYHLFYVQLHYFKTFFKSKFINRFKKKTSYPYLFIPNFFKIILAGCEMDF